MKNNKGFSLIEVLAVLVILGILGTAVTISVTKYRHDVDEKELINLHSTISTGFDNYRSNQLMQGNAALGKMNFCENGKMFLDISYNGKRLTCSEVTNDSFVEIRTKGELLDKEDYKKDRQEADFINDGTCLIESKLENNKFIKNCKVSSGVYEKSLEEMTCIYLKTNDKVIIDDYSDDNNLCHYLG